MHWNGCYSIQLRVFTLVLVSALATAADTAPKGASTYVLYPGDLVQFTVFDHPDLATTVRIPDDGAVNFPLIGAVDHLAGCDLDKVIQLVSARLADGYIKQPIVNATVSTFAPRQLYVMGAVKSQGAIALDPLVATTVMQAIGLAGGMSDEADRAAVAVLRDSAGSSETKTATRVRLDDEAAATLVRPNDIIIVGRLDRVYIIGQVGKPGSVPMSNEEPLSLSKAISQAGGFDRFAKQSKVQLLRPGEKSQTVDVRAILGGKKGVEDPVLKPGDTVFVPESRF
jgi:polysaccharide biosynthesis/export protein